MTEVRRRAPKDTSLPPSRTCDIQGRCGACTTINDDYLKNLHLKHERGLQILRDHGVLTTARILPVHPSPAQLGYRAVAKLVVGAGTDGSYQIGLYHPGTHVLVDLPKCPIHHPAIARCLDELRAQLPSLTDIRPYAGVSAPAQLRYLVLRASHRTGELMMTLVTTSDCRASLRPLIHKLRLAGHKITAAFVNINTEPGNAILGERTLPLAGASTLRESVCGLDLALGPTSFFQVNPQQAETIYHRIEQLAGMTDNDQVAWDLYCGVGQIGMLLARNGYRVLGIEENPEAIHRATDNAARNHLGTQMTFVAGRAEDVLTSTPQEVRAPHLVICNPSRRGLASPVRAVLGGLTTSPTLIYVSCDVQSLARDLADLAQSGYAARQIDAYDMFPHTENMEWLVVCTKAS